MNDKNTWRMYYLEQQLHRVKVRLNISDPIEKRLREKRILTTDELNEWIIEKIRSGEPFALARYGGNECYVSAMAIGKKLGCVSHLDEGLVRALWNCAGVFPREEETAYRFGLYLADISKSIDLMILFQVYMYPYMIRKWCRDDMLIARPTSLEPFFAPGTPWTVALENKKVLVIHPYEKSITRQYESRREKIFTGKYMLPEFELITLKAVQSVAGNKVPYNDWFEALDYMTEEALKKDFDIALIGCGAYGMPLAARLRDAGKQAIHIGGALQLMFGIWGRRWDHFPGHVKLKNEYWVRPLPEETPSGALKVEEGCYW